MAFRKAILLLMLVNIFLILEMKYDASLTLFYHSRDQLFVIQNHNPPLSLSYGAYFCTSYIFIHNCTFPQVLFF